MAKLQHFVSASESGLGQGPREPPIFTKLRLISPLLVAEVLGMMATRPDSSCAMTNTLSPPRPGSTTSPALGTAPDRHLQWLVVLSSLAIPVYGSSVLIGLAVESIIMRACLSLLLPPSAANQCMVET
ncbi:hypothetical protein BGW80DRAFT_1249837 [Lactifluus volemus]|nr:hypothetical protein BGW80DRAFT_1249837 [Lactifluus volemus]